MHNVSELCCYCQNLSNLKNWICSFVFVSKFLSDTEQILLKAAQIVPKLVWCIRVWLIAVNSACRYFWWMLHYLGSTNTLTQTVRSCDIDGLLMCQMKIHFYHDSFLSLLSIFSKVHTLHDISAKEIMWQLSSSVWLCFWLGQFFLKESLLLLAFLVY